MSTVLEFIITFYWLVVALIVSTVNLIHYRKILKVKDVTMAKQAELINLQKQEISDLEREYEEAMTEIES